MNDLLPDRSDLWRHVESTCSKVIESYGYQRIRTPILEKTDLFKRAIGGDTDIVGKEMYTFEDKGGEFLTLRPEGTAPCVRAGIQNGMFYNQQQRLWYQGPMFRRERQQKGRYRQFHQIGLEAYGWESADLDAEIIAISASIFRSLGLRMPELQINSLGSSEARANYRATLVEFLSDYQSKLDEDSKRRLETNPLRILDSKSPDTQAILEKAPSILDCLDEESAEHFENLKTYLGALSIDYVVNPKLVRGLDYYNKSVFEWVYSDFGSQGTVCAGGRYDGLVEQLGGASTPGVGFGLGVERLVMLLEEQEQQPEPTKPHVYFVSVGAEARVKAIALAEQIRGEGFSVILHCGEGSLKNQLKKAAKSGAKYAAILAEDELANSNVTIKDLSNGEQTDVPWVDIKRHFEA